MTKKKLQLCSNISRNAQNTLLCVKFRDFRMKKHFRFMKIVTHVDVCNTKNSPSLKNIGDIGDIYISEMKSSMHVIFEKLKP